MRTSKGKYLLSTIRCGTALAEESGAKPAARRQGPSMRWLWPGFIIGLHLHVGCGDHDATHVVPSVSPRMDSAPAAGSSSSSDGSRDALDTEVEPSADGQRSGDESPEKDNAEDVDGSEPVRPVDDTTPTEPDLVDEPSEEPVDNEPPTDDPVLSEPPEEPPLPEDPEGPPLTPIGCLDPPAEPPPWESGLDLRPTAAALSLPPSLEVAAPGWTTVEAFPALTFDDPLSFGPAPGTDQIVVTEREGKVYAFENDPTTRTKTLILDLSGQNQGELDSGLQSLVFHPEFGQAGSPNRGYVYVHYAYTPSPVVGVIPDDHTPTTSRLARFTMNPETLVVDPSSEQILIDQDDEVIWHQGGSMFFGPDDGFLYLTVGDEGGYGCFYGNCQRIDRDLYSGVLRIDVDMRGGDISHPIPKQPENGRTANYFIPNDNPFVGEPGVLEEFYALGLRSPHRMTHDSIDNITWIGDVGEIQQEELDVLEPGANYQWNYLEGNSPSWPVMPVDPIGLWRDPVLVLNRQEAASVIGGYVYRGSEFPYLYGKYIFGDFVTGNLWALTYSWNGTRATALERELLVSSQFRDRWTGVTSFGVDRNNELYILTLGSEAKIYKLARTAGFSNTPLRLSETGVFVDTAADELEASPGLIPYDVRAPLWSDGAMKQRWLSVPDTGSVSFSESGSWSFPEGTVFVKHFELALDENHPENVRRLETRLLVHGEGGQYYGVTYKWNAEGTDADLLMEGQVEPIQVGLVDGEHRSLRYFYPGPNDCGVCHNPEAGAVLGVRALQLNHEMLYAETGRVSNQLYTWAETGILDLVPDQAAIEELDSYASLTDEAESLEKRIRSYWASNCSMCHGSLANIRANWNAHFDVPLAERGLINVRSEHSGGILIVPGEPEASLLFQRSSTTDPGFGMPPVGRSAADPGYVAALSEWILSLED